MWRGTTGELNSFDPLLVRQHVAGEELKRMQELDKSHVEPEEEVYLIATAWVDGWLVRRGSVDQCSVSLSVL